MSSLINAQTQAGLSQRFQQDNPASVPARLLERLAAPAEETQTPDAVQAAGDSVEVSTQADRMTQLQDIIARLTKDTDADAVTDALRDLKQFVNKNTNAEFVGGVLGDLANMADAALKAIEQNPSALGGNIEFGFSASFNQQNFQSGDYQQSYTSFSLNFSLRTDNTVMSGSVNYTESLEATSNSLRYERSESASLSMVTYNTDIDSNPVLAGFNKITGSLAKQAMEALMGQQEAMKEALAPASNYSPLSFMEKLNEQFNVLENALQQSSVLTEMLEAMQARTEEEKASVALVDA